ncbi:hypothetical protein HHK36_010794 [Tetracentron sinense]|uniref:Uncharacterized protein n=1 Tax=Tetracentron sinense TaxID=13715 RepID=A0A835DGS2_TETSI|nr:hypothetical protein HHK36_010794 [Tetracentron sinense]
MNSISKGKSFWKTALKCFPSKNKESIVSYYLNVFVPRRRSMQMRSASEIINSDDDEADDTLKCMDSRKRYNMKTSYLIRRLLPSSDLVFNGSSRSQASPSCIFTCTKMDLQDRASITSYLIWHSVELEQGTSRDMVRKRSSAKFWNHEQKCRPEQILLKFSSRGRASVESPYEQ